MPLLALAGGAPDDSHVRRESFPLHTEFWGMACAIRALRRGVCAPPEIETYGGLSEARDSPGWCEGPGSGADGQADALKATRCQRPGWALNPSCVRPRASAPFVCGSRVPAAQPACALGVSSSLPPPWFSVRRSLPGLTQGTSTPHSSELSGASFSTWKRSFPLSPRHGAP